MISLRNFFIAFLIALLVFGVSAYYITGFVVDSVQGLISGESVTETEAVTTNEESEVQGGEDVPTHEDIPGESFNILLVGTDYRPSLYNDYSPRIEDKKNGYPMFANSSALLGGSAIPTYPYRIVNADAIVLVCVNENARTVACINIPSEMNITYAGTPTQLGRLYYEKGFEVFKNKISLICGVEIDYYALTSVEQISNVVKVLGSVEYTVPCDMEYHDNDSKNGLHISLSAGRQNIGAKEAADLLSFNSYTDGVNSRANTTLSFLIALAKKMTSSTNLANAYTILSNVQKYVYTNVDKNVLADNIELVFSLKEKFEFISYEYPLNGNGGPLESENKLAIFADN